MWPREELAGRRVEHRAPAEREHSVVRGQRLAHGLRLQRAEVRLAVVDEDVGDGAALGGLDVGVGVAGADVPGGGEQLGDRGLAGAHRADEHDPAAGRTGHLNLRVSR